MQVRYRIKASLLILLILAISFASRAFAIGIGPSIIEMNYEPGYEQTIKAYVSLSADTDQYVTIITYDNTTDGVIFLPENRKLLIPAHEQATFEYKIKLPETMSPGLHNINVGVTESLPEGGGGWIASLAAVFQVIKVRVPYPGKYAEIEFYVPDVSIGDTHTISVALFPRGVETIQKVSGTIDITSDDNSPITTLNLPQLYNLQTNQKAQTAARWDTTGQKPGRYIVRLHLDYDGTAVEKQDSFFIGTESIDIINFTDTVQQGKINKFEVLVMSKWNKPLQNTYADIKISQNGVPVQDIKSFETGLAGWVQTPLEAYLDTKDMQTGDYDTQVIVHFDANSKEKTGVLHVIEQKAPALQFPAPTPTVAVIALVFVILIATIINIILMFRRKKDE
jgi:hypothetical protein